MGRRAPSAVAERVIDDGRPAVLIYAGDLDASGVDILRDFTERCPVFDTVEHVATLAAQVCSLGLTIGQGKGDDSRAQSFRGQLPELAAYADGQVSSGAWPAQRSKRREQLPNVVQVEAEAIRPDVLRRRYAEAIDLYWDTPAYEATLEREEAERTQLAAMARRIRS